MKIFKNQILKSIFSTKMGMMILMGFSSGLPLLIVGSTLQAWMVDEGVDLTVIGIFALVGMPYTVKFFWAPAMDWYVPSFLGRRRGWMILTQVSLAIFIALMGYSNPADSPLLVAMLALLVSFFSSSQDVVLDAYRREYLKDNELGLGSSLFINGYRIGLLVSGAFALSLADQMPWKWVYLILSAFMMVGILTTFFAPEPEVNEAPPKNLKEAVIDPFRDFFSRKEPYWILAFILFYKIGDTMASHMTTPLILDLGFSKSDLGQIAKVFGLAATIGGGFVGGVVMLKLGIIRSLWIFGALQMISTIGFSALAISGKSYPVLASVIAFENLSSGMGTSAYAAFMASLTNRKFTATQYALLSSLMGVPRVIAAAPTGFLAKHLGWEWFFVFCTLIALPGFLLLARIAPLKKKSI